MSNIKYAGVLWEERPVVVYELPQGRELTGEGYVRHRWRDVSLQRNSPA
jgi:hypothetical protein